MVGSARLEKGVAMSGGAVVSEQVYAVRLVDLRWPTQVARGFAIVIAAARRKERGIR